MFKRIDHIELVTAQPERAVQFSRQPGRGIQEKGPDPF